MFSSIYTGLSGMMAYSSGLDTISNNVANLNTPGYKGRDLLFRDVFYQSQSSSDLYGGASGGGVSADESVLSFRQGEVRQTGNQTDVAISGSGFFILQDQGNTYYTRAGQFEFNEDGILVAKGTSATVMGLDSNGNLVEISINGLRTDPSKTTSQIGLSGNMAQGDAQYSISDVEAYDSNGTKHLLKITLTENPAYTPSGNIATSYYVDIKELVGGVETDIGVPQGEIRFQGNGAIAAGYNTYSFSTTFDSGSPTQTIELYFGESGSHANVTNFAGISSDISVSSQDGYGVGSLTEIGFERTGEFYTKYSNNQTHNRANVAMAWFNDLQKLQELGGGLFYIDQNETPIIATATNDGMGELAGGSIELSNTELTQQFTNMIIIQRGYQASSQVLTVANEMAQQLMNMLHGQ
jgi:flagellar hook protein FlgE